MIITPSINLLPESNISNAINLVIVDCSTLRTNAELEYVLDWTKQNGVPKILLLFIDPYSELIQKSLRSKIPLWSWDYDSLREDFKDDKQMIITNPNKYENPFSMSYRNILNLLEGVDYDIQTINDEFISKMLVKGRELYKKVNELAKRYSDDTLEKANKYFLFTLYSIERLTCPLSYYEEVANNRYYFESISQRIKSLTSYKKRLTEHGSSFLPMWAEAITLIELMYEYLIKNPNNSKLQLIIDILKGASIRQKTVLLITQNEAQAEASTKFFEEESKKNNLTLNLDILGIKRLKNDKSYDYCILFGQIPNHQKYLLRLSLAKKIIIPVYQSEREYLDYQIKLHEEYIKNLARYSDRKKIIEFAKYGENKKESENSLPPDVLGQPENITISEYDVAKKVVNEDELLSELIEKNKETEIIGEHEDLDIDDIFEEDEIPATGEIDGLEIGFINGKKIYVSKAKRISLLRQDMASLDYKPASRIKKDDIVLLVNNSVKGELNKVIISKADKHPEIQKMYLYVRSWIVALRNGVEESGLKDKEVLKKLIEMGSQRKSSISYWRRGMILGPQKKEEILYLGKIFKNNFLIDNYEEIFSQIRKLRTIHRVLLRKLSSILLNKGLKVKTDTQIDSPIDETLNLEIEDFINYVDLAKVSYIKEKAKIPVVLLNKVL